MVSTAKILEFLFVSKVRIKTLEYFFLHQDVPVHLRAASRLLDEEINAVRRELMRLCEIKLLKMETRGNRKYFSLNTYFPIYEELNSIFFKSTGLGQAIIKNQSKLGTVFFSGLTTAYVSAVKLAHKDIDLIIIGDIDLNILGEVVAREEQRMNREINYTVLKLSEFNLRKKRKDQFITSLLLNTKVLLVGNRDEYIS